ncbi:MAG TPA: hypothetical protein VES88_15925 [Gemmatimonadaceae bacterium]|nr:hypothetical protein [Gemmatimonadaceae bacterium]
MSVRRNSPIIAIGTLAGLAAFSSCAEIPTSDSAVLSLTFDSLPAPAVVLGDTLRDTTGTAAPIRATVYNFQGNVIVNPPLRFQALDRGIRIDSVTGFVTGDSLRATPARVAVTVDGLQATSLLDVTLRPDTIIPVLERDSLLYSLVDTTKNLSPALAVRAYHSLTSLDSAVKSYIVSFAISSPADPLLAMLVNEAGKESGVDTTDANGEAARRIRLTPARLTALTDSVIVLATVKYRGAHVRGSPARIVLKVQPAAP